jgi:transposase
VKTAKRTALKLHCLIQLPFLNIPCMEVTDGTAADAPMLRRLMRQLGLKEIEEIALDKAYLARWVCTMLAERGVQTILIKPKKNTTARSRGSPAWRRMVLAYLEDREGFIERYNDLRPKAETTFSSLKRTVAHWIRSRKKRMQRKEAYSYVIAYNVIRAVVNPVRLI